MERAIWPRPEGVSTNAIHELKHHIDVLHASTQEHGDVASALEEQQRRLDRLERQSAEMSTAIETLSRDQADVADEVRSMGGWVRNTAMAGLFLVLLFLLLKGVQLMHGMH